MARVTVEDCMKNFPNRFDLTIAATIRARQLATGSSPLVETSRNEKERDKPTVLALREIAMGKIGPEILIPIVPGQSSHS